MRILLLTLALLNDSGSRFTFFEKRLPESFQGATITGIVVDARTMQPLRGAMVSAARIPTDKPDAPPNIGFRTGEDGKFVLRGVKAGVVSFTVLKAGYTFGPFTSVRPAVDGERIDDVILTVPPGAVMSGLITDEAGQPVAGVDVAVNTASPPPGTKPELSLRTSGRTTDDGRYLVGGLPAGSYTLTVGSMDDMAEVLSQVRPITLAAGEERADVDLTIRFHDRSVGPRRLDTGTAIIQGRVVDPGGVGIPQSPVMLRQDTKAASMVMTRTDGSGQFRFERVPEGAYVVSPARIIGRSVSDGVGLSIDLKVTAGSRTDNVLLSTERGGTISGTITDEFGEPASAQVVAIQPIYVPVTGSGSTLVTFSTAQGLGRSSGTDVRGRYRITNLPRGEHLISVLPEASMMRAEVHFIDEAGRDRILPSASTLYPGVQLLSQATKIRVSENGDASDVDVTLRPVLLATIAVTVTAGRPFGQMQLQQLLMDDALPIPDRTIRSTEPNVTFDVRPGRHRLVASAEVPAGADSVVRLWSTAEVYTDVGNPASVTMALEPGANIAGRIAFDGKEPNRQNAGAWLVPTDVLPAMRAGVITGNATLEPATGRFSMEGVMPGRYVLNGGGAERGRSGWMLKAATLNGRDVLDEPIDLRPGDDITDVRLTVTDRVTEISGAVLDAAGKPAVPAGWVLAFSAEKKHWWPGSRRVRVVRPGPASKYRVSALPPGQYVIATLFEVLAEADLIAKLPALAAGGVRVTLAEGEKRVQDLRVK